MALSLGSALATRVYLGATEINLAYFGATQVYSSAAFSAEAQDYFDRLDTAGDTTYVDYKLPLANYIDGLVTLGGAYWDDMLSACSYVGVGIQGITVPLRAGMTVATNVNNNFVAGDLDVLTGLKGDASTKYIDTGVSSNALALNDHSWSVFITERATAGRYISAAGYNHTIVTSGPSLYARDASTTNYLISSSTANNRLAGTSRDNSANFNWLYETSGTQTSASSSIVTADIAVFAESGGTNKTSARFATYHVGPALNLATLEALQATLLSEVAAAKGAVAAANYFARLDTAGDTTYVPYKQPLTNYISSLVALGGAYWDDMVSATSFVGVGIQGITVPLRDGMTVATNNNFVAGDLDQLTGLKGDASTKWINLGVTDSDTLRDDVSLSNWVSVQGTINNKTSVGNHVTGMLDQTATTAVKYVSRTTNTDTINVSPTLSENFIGQNRTSGTGFDYQINGISGSFTKASIAPIAAGMSVFKDQAFNRYSNSRLATYHYGPALDLATLEGLQDTLITEIAAI